jgi:hypothetical protein
MKYAEPKPKVTYRQIDGDDGYCYAVFVNGRQTTYASLTRREAMHEKEKIIKAWETRVGFVPK